MKGCLSVQGSVNLSSLVSQALTQKGYIVS